jgi:hypothetical protein
VLVRDIICKFEFVEGDDLLHPLLPGGGAVGVDVHALGHLRVGLAGDHPATAMHKYFSEIQLPALKKGGFGRLMAGLVFV